MSRVICVMGESGAGKTTSMRNLDPAATYYIDCDGKGLAWKGWRKQYNSERRNFAVSRDISRIETLMDNLSQSRPDLKTIVIDTLNTCMVDYEKYEYMYSLAGSIRIILKPINQQTSFSTTYSDDFAQDLIQLFKAIKSFIVQVL